MAFALKKGNVIDDFTVQFPIKNNDITQTYRVIRKDGEKGALKIYFRGDEFPNSLLNKEGKIREIVNLERLRNCNGVPKLFSSGFAKVGDHEFEFIISEYISGETLSEALMRGKVMSPDLSRFYCKQLAEIINGFHEKGVLHNEICPDNIMIEYHGDEERLLIIDFGSSTGIENCGELVAPNMDLNYISSNALQGIFNRASDIYSLFATIYKLIHGDFHYNIDSVDGDLDLIIESHLEARKVKFTRPVFVDVHLDSFFELIVCGLGNGDDEIIKSFNSVLNFKLEQINPLQVKSSKLALTSKKSEVLAGPKGFEAIAGMESLKVKLREEVLEALRNPEKFKQYRLTIPNGMLLYGPPGCGKTFFAKKFSEEAQMEYYHVRPSDLGSIYIHGSQEKIAKLFQDARDSAPSIIFFDELDALLPTRDQSNHQSSSAEVNEFLTQMDNTGSEGVFVIGATNRRELIDPAILRAGRLDYKILIPPPDFLARKSIFQLELSGRPVDGSIDFEELSHCTEGFVSSDLKLIVDTAARKALKDDSQITHGLVMEVIKINEPSINKDLIKKYSGENEISEDGRESKLPKPIGFKIQRNYS